MRILWGILLAAVLFALPAHADTINYTLTVNNSLIGNFSWTIQTDGFIKPFFECVANCDASQVDQRGVIVAECTGQDCDDYNFFTSFVAVSEPSDGDGCQITGAWLYAFDYGSQPATEFSSPSCDGNGGAIVEYGIPTGPVGGVTGRPLIGVTGTWSWQVQNPGAILNPDGTEDFTESDVTLTVSDVSSSGNSKVPEPDSLALLALGLSVFIPLKLRRLLDGHRGLAL